MRPELSRYLSVQTAKAGAHTADRSRVAFLTDITGLHQVWTVPAQGGWPDQVSFGTDRVLGLLPSPADPDLLVFGRDAGGNERAQLHAVAPDGTGERPLATDPETIHRLGAWTPDGRWLLFCANDRNGVDFDLYRVAAAGGEPEKVAELEGWHHVVQVTDDGTRALLVRSRSNVDSDLLLVNLDTGEVGVPTAHDGEVRNLPGAATPDGLFVLSDRDGEFLQAYRIARFSAEWQRFGPADWDVEELVVRAGVGALTVNVDGLSRLLLFDPRSLETTAEVALPTGVASDLRLSPDGSQLSFTFSGPRHNDDVWLADTSTTPSQPTRSRRLTRSSLAGLDPERLAEPELVRIESFDGVEVPAWVYRPAGFERPPVLVSVHGGPEAQARPSFNALQQYFVACGYAVVVPNVRGSTGYGKGYSRLDDRRKRMDAVADLAEVGRWATRQPELDGGRLAVMGGSYGGFMVLAALATYPDLWQAGVDIVGIANFVTFLEQTGSYRRALREVEYGSLAEDRDFLERISPLTHVEKIVAPLLVIHGANDPRVPVGEARQIVDRLAALDRPVESLIFDDEGHGIAKLANRQTAYETVAAFLDRHLA
jgi:dipeptidyl aminopeptidase/acylaminoacyl peptidase